MGRPDGAYVALVLGIAALAMVVGFVFGGLIRG